VEISTANQKLKKEMKMALKIQGLGDKAIQ
jgi:hypothetical protein